jgi:hypothetical protein
MEFTAMKRGFALKACGAGVAQNRGKKNRRNRSRWSSSRRSKTKRKMVPYEIRLKTIS